MAGNDDDRNAVKPTEQRGGAAPGDDRFRH